MYECGYMYFRFDRRHLEFLSDIDVCYIDKDFLEFTQQKRDIQRYFIQPLSRISGYFATFCYHIAYFR